MRFAHSFTYLTYSLQFATADKHNGNVSKKSKQHLPTSIHIYMVECVFVVLNAIKNANRNVINAAVT